MFTSLSNLTDSKLFIVFARIFGGILSRNNFSLKEKDVDGRRNDEVKSRSSLDQV